MEKIEKYLIQKNKNEKIYTSTKLLYAIFMSLATLLIDIKGVGFLIVIINIFVSLISKVSRKYLTSMAKVLLPIVTLMFIFQLFITDGDIIIFRIGPFNCTKEGLDSAITFSSNIAGIASSIMLFFQSTSTGSIINALQNANVSKTVIFVISSTLLFLPESKKISKTIKDAQESRGVNLSGSLLNRITSFIPMLAPLALSTISRNEEKVLTLESRGFSSKEKQTRLYLSEKKTSDKMIEFILIVLIIFLIIGRIFIWN